jgi:hypothetical protein
MESVSLTEKVKDMIVSWQCDDSAIRVVGICILQGRHLLSGRGCLLTLSHTLLELCLSLP